MAGKTAAPMTNLQRLEGGPEYLDVAVDLEYTS